MHARREEFGPTAPGGPRRGGAWPLDIDPADGPVPAWDEPGEAAPYVAVDGGVSNNEPFEYARFALRADAGDPQAPWRLAPNPREADRADRAVVMIDPFPENRPVHAADPANAAERALTVVLGRLFGALVAQARLKPEELAAAASGEVYSRFLVSPKRSGPEGETRQGADAIACGALNGFGGFFDEAYRRHDFVLGRRNCQRFLARHFVLDAENPVFDGARYGALPGGRQPILFSDGGGLEGEEGASIPEPPRPLMPLVRLDASEAAIAKRLDALFEASLRRGVAVRLARWSLRRVWRNGLDAAVLRQARRLVERDLMARAQLDVVFPEGSDAACLRAVLAEIAGSSVSLRSPWGVALALDRADALGSGTKPPDRPASDRLARVEAAFAVLVSEAAPPAYRLLRRSGEGARALHHLEGRGPSLWRRLLPGLRVDDDLGDSRP